MKPNTPRWKNSKYKKRLEFISKTTNSNVLFEIAKCDLDTGIVMEAIKKINDEALLKILLELPLNKERFGCFNSPVITRPFNDNYEEIRIAIINKITDLSFLLNLNRENQVYFCRPYQMGFNWEHHGTHIIEALDKRIEYLKSISK